MKMATETTTRRGARRVASLRMSTKAPRLSKQSRVRAPLLSLNFKEEEKPKPAATRQAEPVRFESTQGNTLQLYLREIGQVKLLTPAEEIGKVFGVTRERIRQIEGEALKKLRVKMEQRDTMRN